jgi:hypothetical protein
VLRRATDQLEHRRELLDEHDLSDPFGDEE